MWQRLALVLQTITRISPLISFLHLLITVSNFSGGVLFAGPKVVLFLHGFPQIWYTWRYQMIAVAKAGYRAIAYDFRGYGLSELPAEPEKGGFIDLVEDTIALLDTLGISKVMSFLNLYCFLSTSYHES
jgi:pimeloyl-ACP methyl ester carboxylesterase